MKETSILGLSLALSLTLSATALAQEPLRRVRSDPSIQVFWEKFKAAVIKQHKTAVADLSQFPNSNALWRTQGEE